MVFYGRFLFIFDRPINNRFFHMKSSHDGSPNLIEDTHKMNGMLNESQHNTIQLGKMKIERLHNVHSLRKHLNGLKHFCLVDMKCTFNVRGMYSQTGSHSILACGKLSNAIYWIYWIYDRGKKKLVRANCVVVAPHCLKWLVEYILQSFKHEWKLSIFSSARNVWTQNAKQPNKKKENTNLINSKVCTVCDIFN